MTEQMPESSILTTYVTEEMKDDLVALAEENDRSVAAELRIAIRRHLRLEREKATT